MARGAQRGYLPDLANNILVVSPWNVPRAEAFFRGYGLEIMTGSRYIYGFMGIEAAYYWWIKGKLRGWSASVDIINGVACKHPQTSYAGLQR